MDSIVLIIANNIEAFSELLVQYGHPDKRRGLFSKKSDKNNEDTSANRLLRTYTGKPLHNKNYSSKGTNNKNEKLHN